MHHPIPFPVQLAIREILGRILGRLKNPLPELVGSFYVLNTSMNTEVSKDGWGDSLGKVLISRALEPPFNSQDPHKTVRHAVAYL